MFTIEGKYTTTMVFADQVEASCIAQITAMVNHPAFTGAVAIMPDTHAGKGSVIGFTMPLGDAIIPAIVGSDIGCGVLAARVPWPADVSLEVLDRTIRWRVPFGQAVRCDSHHELAAKDPFYEETRGQLAAARRTLNARFADGGFQALDWGASQGSFEALCERVGMDYRRAQRSIGTLGGGNHFIEIGRGKFPDMAWVLVHSGSRQLGEKICKYHQRVAAQQVVDFREVVYQAEIERIRRTAPRQEIDAQLRAYKAEQRARVNVPAGMEVLRGEDLFAYVEDMVFAQAYAAQNRSAIMAEVLKAISMPPGVTVMAIDTVHNYIDPVDLIIRKGAVAARAGQTLVIPFNMRDGSWFCRGRGNSAWNCSAPHGAGRVMSRSQAKRDLDPAEAQASMAGIYTSCIPLDEAPKAYKSAAEIRAAIGPTIDVIEEIRPIMNLKEGAAAQEG
jgi:tRNA-splicing ligase RtcB (3'-phosphate/5'-hydroxy nucleic acid ligase)